MFKNQIPMPRRMQQLPRDRRGYPVPWSVYVDPVTSQPDFRVIDYRRKLLCLKNKQCGMCGEPLGKFIAFIGGPNSRDSHVYSDPPMHRECAEYAAKVCPHISRETAQYSDRPINDVSGVMFVEDETMPLHRAPEFYMVICHDFKVLTLTGAIGDTHILAGDYTEVVLLEQYRSTWSAGS